jgi:hypothetical protein
MGNLNTIRAEAMGKDDSLSLVLRAINSLFLKKNYTYIDIYIN